MAAKAVEVKLADERVITVREPKPTEYIRIMAAGIPMAKIAMGEALTDADELNVRTTMALLSTVTVDGQEQPFTAEDIGALSYADWARLWVGYMQVSGETVTERPLAKPRKTPKTGSSSPTKQD